jgi:hypothetical protein
VPRAPPDEITDSLQSVRCSRLPEPEALVAGFSFGLDMTTRPHGGPEPSGRDERADFFRNQTSVPQVRPGYSSTCSRAVLGCLHDRVIEREGDEEAHVGVRPQGGVPLRVRCFARAASRLTGTVPVFGPEIGSFGVVLGSLRASCDAGRATELAEESSDLSSLGSDFDAGSIPPASIKFLRISGAF